MKNNTCKICGTALIAIVISIEAGPVFGCEHCHLPQHAPENGGFSYDFSINIPSVSASGITTSSSVMGISPKTW